MNPVYAPTWLPAPDGKDWRLVDVNTGTFLKNRQRKSLRWERAEDALAHAAKHGLEVAE